jgi:hypothetical protein
MLRSPGSVANATHCTRRSQIGEFDQFPTETGIQASNPALRSQEKTFPVKFDEITIPIYTSNTVVIYSIV